MKTRALHFLLVASALAWSLRAAAPANSKAAQSERLKQRIDALLKHRLKPDPLPVILPNPFAVVSGSVGNLKTDDSDTEGVQVTTPENAVATARPRTGPDVAPGSNAEALAFYAAKLRIGGMVKIKGQLQIVINDSPRKEGDTIVLDRNNTMTYLVVVRIAPGELTLRLNDATQTIKF